MFLANPDFQDRFIELNDKDKETIGTLDKDHMLYFLSPSMSPKQRKELGDLPEKVRNLSIEMQIENNQAHIGFYEKQELKYKALFLELKTSDLRDECV